MAKFEKEKEELKYLKGETLQSLNLEQCDILGRNLREISDKVEKRKVLSEFYQYFPAQSIKAFML